MKRSPCWPGRASFENPHSLYCRAPSWMHRSSAACGWAVPACGLKLLTCSNFRIYTVIVQLRHFIVPTIVMASPSLVTCENRRSRTHSRLRCGSPIPGFRRYGCSSRRESMDRTFYVRDFLSATRWHACMCTRVNRSRRLRKVLQQRSENSTKDLVTPKNVIDAVVSGRGAEFEF